MALDVTVRRVIPLPPEQVSAYAMDWCHDTETRGIRQAELTREADGGGFGVGAEVTRTVYFLGRRIDYVLRVTAHEPPRLLDMIATAAPMPMHVTRITKPNRASPPAMDTFADASTRPAARSVVSTRSLRQVDAQYRAPCPTLMVNRTL